MRSFLRNMDIKKLGTESVNLWQGLVTTLSIAGGLILLFLVLCLVSPNVEKILSKLIS